MLLHRSILSLATLADPIVIPSHDPSRPAESRLKLAIPIDLRLPGWLPPSHTSTMTATTYGVVVQMNMRWQGILLSNAMSAVPVGRTYMENSSRSLKREHRNSFFVNHSLSPGTIEKSISPYFPFILRRHRIPASITGPAYQGVERHCLLTAGIDESPIDCVATVPDWVDVTGPEKALKVSLRIRVRNLSSIGRKPPSPATEGAISAVGNTGGLSSVPMERNSTIKRKEGQVLASLLELGLKVDETERFS